MAATAATAAVPTIQPQGQVTSTSLCEYCHQKARFSNHLYCSKTCASQAATLCNQCHKKPKYQNFEYCGKNCAALAGASHGKQVNRNVGAGAPSAGATQVKGANGGKNQPQAFDPIQLAKLVAQHIPQVQALLNPQVVAVQPQPQPVPPHIIANNPFPAPGSGLGLGLSTQVQSQVVPVNNPFLDPNNYVNGPQNGATSGTQQASDNTQCIIPSCGKPVHIDAKGVKASDYCSMRCREEAVSSGLRSPCIMCLTLPQSEMDYFCSKTCREVSMNKTFEVEVDED